VNTNRHMATIGPVRLYLQPQRSALPVCIRHNLRNTADRLGEYLTSDDTIASNDNCMIVREEID
jgi:hypothetical protein